MPTITSFEDLEVWRQSRELTARIFRTANQGPLKRDFALKDQLCRSAMSVMANIAEGYGRKTDRDFANFLYTSKASALETISHLYIAKDQDYISQETLTDLRTAYQKIIGKLIRLIRHLESNPRRNRHQP